MFGAMEVIAVLYGFGVLAAIVFVLFMLLRAVRAHEAIGRNLAEIARNSSDPNAP